MARDRSLFSWLPLAAITQSNVRWLRNKVDEFSTLVRWNSDYRQTSLFSFTETWLFKVVDPYLDSFNIPHCNRDAGKTQKSVGGGLCMAVNKRLPIPNLHDTMRRYLAVQRTLFDDDQFRTTEKYAEDFLNTVGPGLQKELVLQDKYNKHTSYISELWVQQYLCRRSSMMLHNAYTSITPDPRKEYNDQLVRATNIVCSALRFMKTLRAGLLEPSVLHLNPAKSDTDRFKRFIRWVPSSLSCYAANVVNAYPLDMSQFCRMFNSTRIPKRGLDELFTDDKGRHVLVMRKGNMYVFDVVDRDGNLVKPAEIQSHLKYILCDPAPAPDFPLGVLTTVNRNVWADLREKLVATGNAKNLWMVDSALLCLCLDDEGMNSLVDLLYNVIHGNGYNRWFDKSFSIILAQDGQAGISLEHSWGDGRTLMRFQNEVFKDSTEQPQVHPGSAAATVDTASAVRRLHFNLNRELEDSIRLAKENFDSVTSKLSIGIVDFQEGGKKRFKKHKVSPDAMVQLAFQMAFLRLYGRTVYVYEACSTARFKHGRMEVIRSASIYTKQCSHAFVCQPGQHSVGQLKAMLHECSTYHRQLINEASVGQGTYCHLTALNHLAKSKYQAPPNLFTDPAFTGFTSGNPISSSNLSATSLPTAVFFPETPDGFGLPYGIHDNRIVSSVTSYPACNNQEFVQSVTKYLKDIFTVLEEKPLN